MAIHHYHVQTPEGLSFNWFGGPAEPDGDYIWLTTPAGKGVLRLPRQQVTPSTPEATAERTVADRKEGGFAV